MSSEKPTTVQPVAALDQPSAIRYSRVLRFGGALAIGLTFSIGLGVYVLLGQFMLIAGWQVAPAAYLLLAVIAIPFLLSYAERATASYGESGVYSLVRFERNIWRSFATVWVLAAGYATLVALFGWGAGIYLRTGLSIWLGAAPSASWLGMACIAGVALFVAVGRGTSRSLRMYVVLGAVAFIAFLILHGLITPSSVSANFSSAGNPLSLVQIATLMGCTLWALSFIVGSRNELWRPQRTLLPAMATTVALGATAGMLAALVVIAYHGAIALQTTPFVDIGFNGPILDDALLHLLYLGFGIAISLIGLRLVLMRSLRLIDAMHEDGFLPRGANSDARVGWLMFLTLMVVSGGLLALPIQALIAFSALLFFWSSALIHLPEPANAQSSLPEKRWPKLPFHPLFPALTTAIGLLLPLPLLTGIWWLAAPWLLGGLLYYYFYARNSALIARRRVLVLGDVQTSERDQDSEMRILVAVGQNDTAANLIRAAQLLARSQQSEIVLFRALELPEQMPLTEKHGIAQHNWADLNAFAEQMRQPGLPIRPVVRIAPSATVGIAEAVKEEAVDLLVLGWKKELPGERQRRRSTLSALVRKIACECVIVRGTIPETTERVVVATAGDANASVGLRFARQIVPSVDGTVSLVYVNTGGATADNEARALRRLAQTVDGANAQVRRESDQDAADLPQVRSRVVAATSVYRGVLDQTEGADLLVLGAARERTVNLSSFSGVPEEIARAAPIPTLIFTGRDQFRYGWLHRAWVAIYDVIPNLTGSRRAEVVEIMRSSAIPSVDFFVLIILASTIASLGLLQDSAAVIIGAMLVAPLMSPILAMAMAIVLGDLRMLRMAAESTSQGAAMAILVGVIVTIISPIDAVTNELLSRTHSNVLDLLVALASGAAAGYAISRKEVAAALPGVAIAAALVPPLCVVGYGFGTSDLTIAGGALLLFVTNLIAIVLAAATVFLALGFYPERGERKEVARALRITVISLALVSAVLIATTVVTVREINQRRDVEEIFSLGVVAQAAEVKELTISRRDGNHLIEATILSLNTDQMTSDDLVQLENEIEAAVGSDVKIDATIIAAVKTDLAGIEKIRLASDIFHQRIEENQAEVSQFSSDFRRERLGLTATVIAYDGSSLNDAVLTDIQQEISEAAAMPVDLKVTTLSGNRSEILAQPTSTPPSTR